MAEITNREQELFESLKPIVEPLGVRLIDIELKTHGGESRLRVVVDDEEGVGLALCEKISKQVAPVMEIEEPGLLHKFELEVSSPGLRRRLRRDFEYDYFSSRQVVVKCFGSFKDRKQWKGKLEGISAEGLIIETTPSAEPVTIPLEQVASVRLFFDAEEALNSGGSSNDG